MHVSIPGKKVDGWNKLFFRYPDVLVRYDRIALVDDDIITDTFSLNKCFDMGAAYGLAIWQPGLSFDSFATYAAFLANPLYKLRYVNFIEMMCPFFTSRQLQAVLPLFSMGFESGIDLVWCSIANEDGGRRAGPGNLDRRISGISA
jgi:hypothetical protein